MPIETFSRSVRIRASVERVFAWHSRPEALKLLIPPGEPIRLECRKGGLETGAVAVASIGYGPLRIQWLAVHRDYILNRQFRDVQVKGPFAHWVHTHLFVSDGPDACVLKDHVEYALPLSPISDALVGRLIRRRLEKMFAYRHAVTRRELEREP